jgi:hypothetical protein
LNRSDICGSIHAGKGADPPPLVFSAEYDRFVTICPDRLVPDELEATLRGTKHCSAREIYDVVRDRAMSFAAIEEDMTVVVIKKTGPGA